MTTRGEHQTGREAIVGRIGGGLLLVCGLTAAVALDWRPMRGNDIGDRIYPPRRAVAVPAAALPARIEECERYAVEVCGTWTLQPDGAYRGAWGDGATGTLRVIEFGATGFVAYRVDDAPGNLVALYEGSVVYQGQRVSAGLVRWTTGGGAESHAGSWTAEWEPPVHPANTRESQRK